MASKELKATKKRTVLKLNYKRAIGVRCLAWQAAAGKGSVSPLKDFLLTFRDYSGLAPPKKDRVWLARCIVLAKDFDLQMDSLALCHSGGKRKTMARGLTPDKFLTRRRGMCGPGYKCRHEGQCRGEHITSFCADEGPPNGGTCLAAHEGDGRVHSASGLRSGLASQVEA